MRIISGKYRGKKIIAPKNLPIRPTTDQAKEALFNILTNYFNFEEVKVLDLFAGSGNISYEFASRGCPDITAVEISNRCIQYIKRIKETLRLEEIYYEKSDVFKYLKNCADTYDLIFADPPYDLKSIDQLPNLVFENELLNKNGWLIIEHTTLKNFETNPNFKEKRVYGQSAFSIFGVG